MGGGGNENQSQPQITPNPDTTESISVTSITPTSAVIGTPTQFTIAGNHFTDKLKVTLEGANCDAGNLVSATEYQISCQHDTAESLDMVVNDGSKDIYTQAITFSASTAPTPTPTPVAASVTAIIPNSAEVGKATEFVITGANLNDKLKVTLTGATCQTGNLVSASTYTISCQHDTAENLDMVVNDGSKDIYTHAITFSASTAPTPVIASVFEIKPKIATVGTPTEFVITGLNFTNRVNVTLEDANCQAGQLVSVTEYRITCQHDKAANLAMVVKDGTYNVYGDSVYFEVAPVVASVTAISPTAAYTNTPTEFVITGQNLTNQINVTLNGATCQAGSLVSATEYKISCQHDTVEALHMVVKDGSKVLKNQAITFTAAPVVASVSNIAPTSATVSTPTEFVITGQNLTNQINVTLNGATCQAGNLISATEYKISCQHDTAESVDMVVKDGSKVLKNQAITFTAAPVVASVSNIAPTSATVGTPTEFVITGQNLTNQINVTLNGATCQAGNLVSATEYKISCQHNTAESVDMVVKDGSKVLKTQAITFTAAPASVDGISPVTAYTNTPTEFVITGQNLTNQINVTLGGATCQAGSLVSATEYKINCQHNTAEALNMVVTDGTKVLDTKTITFYAAPVVASVSAVHPILAKVGRYTQFVITGQNFTSKLNVKFGAKYCQNGTLVSPTEYTIRCQHDKAETVDLQILDDTQLVKTQAITFTSAPATVSSISPTSAYIAEPTEFVVTGQNFTDSLNVSMNYASYCPEHKLVSATKYTFSCNFDRALKIDVRVYDGTSQAIYSQSIQFKVPAPQNVTATRQDANTIDLTWQGAHGASSYNVYYANRSFANIPVSDYAKLPNGERVTSITGTQTTLKDLPRGRDYFIVVTAADAGRVESIKSNEVEVPDISPPSKAVKLNDTGITKCGTADKTSNKENCASAVANATGAQVPLGQDGHIGTGKNGAREIKMLDVPGYIGRCVQDVHTGLMWEVKTTAQGLHNDNNTYSWYNPDSSNNGGFAGKQNGGRCQGSACDTDALVKAVNQQGWCGYHDWRLPTLEELSSIIDYGRSHPARSPIFFPNMSYQAYWTATPTTIKQRAWLLDMSTGSYLRQFDKAIAYHAHLVRGR